MEKSTQSPHQKSTTNESAMDAHAFTREEGGQSMAPPAFQLQAGGSGDPIQRTIKGYVKNRTLACNTKAMRNLSLSQREVVQELHDDPNKEYTVDEARKKATGQSSTSNPYEWEVTGLGNYVAGDSGIQSVLSNFGTPTTDVIKKYTELADRIKFDVGTNQKGNLSSTVLTDLKLVMEASKPLHLGVNGFLNASWHNKLDTYSGSKTGIPLYSVGRSYMTSEFKAEKVQTLSLNQILNAVSSRPFELHHLLYKAKFPKYATLSANLMLTQRSKKESVEGPGQHELMHMLSSGNSSNKFNVLLGPVVQVVKEWTEEEIGNTAYQ